MQQLRFEQRHVHVRGTFGSARFARKTIAQSTLHFDAAKRIAVGETTPLQRGPDGISSAARGHDLFSRHQKRRTHGWRFLSATSAAVALFEVTDEGAIFGREGQAWHER